MSNLARLTIALTLVMACVDLAPPPQLQVGDLPLDPASGGRTTMASGGSPGRGGSGGNAPDASNDAGDAIQPPPDSSPPDSGPASSIDAIDLGSSPPPTLLVNGTVCSSGGKCASGFCVDGVCCDDACGGLCQACNVYGAEGTCAPIVQGEDPADECAQDAIATCGRDGTCNGAGQCRKYLPGTECAQPGCQGATEAAAGTCDGAGICRAGTTRSCAPNVCKGSSCGSACSSPADCQTGYFCDAGTCAVKRATAAACSAAQQCTTGFCVDGVCCGSACTETCSVCNLVGAAGICTAVPDGLDPRGNCPAQPASSCGRAGACNGARACRLHPATTTCVAASCSGSTATPAAQCDGAGSCVAPAPRSCGGYQCSGTTCGGSCTGDSQCSAGYSCKSGSCQLLKITNLTVYDTANASSWSIQRNFQIGTGGAHPWVDYAPSYISSIDAAANVLLGKEWIKIAAASKLYTGGPQAAITLAAASDVYIMVDDRWGTTPSFTAGWSNTGWNLVVWETSSRSFTFSIFRKTAQTGTVTFPSIGSNTTYDFFTVVD
jgi:hypothetical protein